MIPYTLHNVYNNENNQTILLGNGVGLHYVAQCRHYNGNTG